MNRARIYIVGLSDATTRFFIRAINSRQARNYVARETMVTRVATQDDLVRAAQDGALKVADAVANEILLRE